MLLAVCQARGTAQEAVPRIATPFGGGMAGSGSTCGALVGALMSLGLHLGRSSAEGDNRTAYRAAQQVFDGFRSEMGSVLCRELTGIDLRTRDGLQQLRASGVSERVCLRAGALAARLAQQALAEADAGIGPARQ